MIVGLTGKSQHGKSQVARILVEEHGFHELALADPMVRSASAVLGIDPALWDELKNSEYARVIVCDAGGFSVGSQTYANISVREFFQRYGTEGHRDIPEFGEDVWRDMVDHKMADLIAQHGKDVNIVVSDVRMRNEADLIRAYEGAVVEVYRPQQATRVTIADNGHVSERGVQADFVIWNGGDDDDLRKTIRFDILGVGGALRGVGESHRPFPINARPLGDDRIG